MQFVDLFVLNLEAPIQHASDFCRFSLNELNVPYCDIQNCIQRLKDPLRRICHHQRVYQV